MTQDQEPVRQRLLGEATRLFAEQGFESTSVQEVVAAAGVTKGAMYHYFDSKDDLLHEIYGRVLRMQMERLTHFADSPGPVAERLYAAASDVVTTTVDNLDDSKIFFRSMHLLAPDTRKSVRAERRRYHERFRDLVTEGQREGTFRSDTPRRHRRRLLLRLRPPPGHLVQHGGRALRRRTGGALRRPAAHLLRPELRTGSASTPRVTLRPTRATSRRGSFDMNRDETELPSPGTT